MVDCCQQYSRASDAAEEQEAEDGDMKRAYFNHIALAYKYYMAGNDDAIEELDAELGEKYGTMQGSIERSMAPWRGCECVPGR